jgi:iron-sulfur cluster assembly accessory protein
MMSEIAAELPVTMSPSAVRRLSAVLAGEPPGSMLRIAVNGGGCSGFQYQFEITTNRDPDDLFLEEGGAAVVIDAISLAYLQGSQIDFVDDLIGQSFKIHNPNATASCGCGTSFSV